MTHRPVTSNITENKNLTVLDEELELEIEKANSVIRNLGDAILSVYSLARKKGYSPLDARKIVEERIINVTPRYIRGMLPEETKHIEKKRNVLEQSAELEFRKSESENRKAKHISPLETPKPEETKQENKPVVIETHAEIQDAMIIPPEKSLEEQPPQIKEPEPTPLVSGKLTWEKGKEAKDLAFFFIRRSASLTMQDAAHRDIVLDLQTKKMEWGKWEEGGE